VPLISCTGSSPVGRTTPRYEWNFPRISTGVKGLGQKAETQSLRSNSPECREDPARRHKVGAGRDRLSNIHLVPPISELSASVANAGAEMVRELLHREQGGRQLAPCIIAEERPANQAGLST
jgi:hypothetical protein